MLSRRPWGTTCGPGLKKTNIAPRLSIAYAIVHLHEAGIKVESFVERKLFTDVSKSEKLFCDHSVLEDGYSIFIISYLSMKLVSKLKKHVFFSTLLLFFLKCTGLFYWVINIYSSTKNLLYNFN